MKTGIWPDETSMAQMGDWLAELRDDAGAEPPAGRHARLGSAQGPPAEPCASAPDRATAPVETIPPAEAMPRAEARARVTGRAVIGDELRTPIMWCEMGACISRYSDPAALGEADIRARAIGAGWRVDALGRLACPGCQQTNGRFWATHPVTLHDRDSAVTLTALMAAAAALREDAAGWGRAGTEVIPDTGRALVPLPAQGRHREFV